MCLSSGIFRAGQEHLTEIPDLLGLLPCAGYSGAWSGLSTLTWYPGDSISLPIPQFFQAPGFP